MQDESSELARRAAAGDRAALETLWRLHRRWLAAVILAHRPRRADADDLLQDVAMAVVRSIPHLRDPARLRPWLRAVALNTVRARGRRAAAAPPAVNGQAATGEPHTPERGAAFDRSEAERACALMGELPLRYREPLLLHALRDLSTRHIAEALELPVKTVETRLWRARRLLWDALARDGARRPATGGQRPAAERSDQCTIMPHPRPTC